MQKKQNHKNTKQMRMQCDGVHPWSGCVGGQCSSASHCTALGVVERKVHSNTFWRPPGIGLRGNPLIETESGCVGNHWPLQSRALQSSFSAMQCRVSVEFSLSEECSWLKQNGRSGEAHIRGALLPACTHPFFSPGLNLITVLCLFLYFVFNLHQQHALTHPFFPQDFKQRQF